MLLLPVGGGIELLCAHGRVNEARFEVLLAILIASKVRFVLQIVSSLQPPQRNTDPLSVIPHCRCRAEPARMVARKLGFRTTGRKKLYVTQEYSPSGLLLREAPPSRSSSRRDLRKEKENFHSIYSVLRQPDSTALVHWLVSLRPALS